MKNLDVLLIFLPPEKPWLNLSRMNSIGAMKTAQWSDREDWGALLPVGAEDCWAPFLVEDLEELELEAEAMKLLSEAHGEKVDYLDAARPDMKWLRKENVDVVVVAERDVVVVVDGEGE